MKKTHPLVRLFYYGLCIFVPIQVTGNNGPLDTDGCGSDQVALDPLPVVLCTDEDIYLPRPPHLPGLDTKLVTEFLILIGRRDLTVTGNLLEAIAGGQVQYARLVTNGDFIDFALNMLGLVDPLEAKYDWPPDEVHVLGLLAPDKAVGGATKVLILGPALDKVSLDEGFGAGNPHQGTGVVTDMQ